MNCMDDCPLEKDCGACRTCGNTENEQDIEPCLTCVKSGLNNPCMWTPKADKLQSVIDED